MSSQRFSESHGIVPLVESATGDYNAGFTADSVDMSKYNHYTLIIIGDNAVAGNGVLTIYGGATDAATTAAATFTYRYSSGIIGAASSDVLGTAATSAALTITGTSLVSAILVCELDAEDLNISGTQYRYVTPVLSAAGTAGYVAMVAILSEPRYLEAVMDTANPA